MDTFWVLSKSNLSWSLSPNSFAHTRITPTILGCPTVVDVDQCKRSTPTSQVRSYIPCPWFGFLFLLHTWKQLGWFTSIYYITSRVIVLLLCYARALLSFKYRITAACLTFCAWKLDQNSGLGGIQIRSFRLYYISLFSILPLLIYYKFWIPTYICLPASRTNLKLICSSPIYKGLFLFANNFRVSTISQKRSWKIENNL